MKRFILILCFGFSWAGILAQNATDSIRNKFLEDVRKSMKQRKVMGASIAVVSKDSVLWIENIGFEDAENQKPVNENTLFGLGSVTKVFTSTAVMQLQEKGEIDISKPFKNYLPEFKLTGDWADMVTPKNMLTHHSGLPSDILSGMFSYQPENYKSVVNYINEECMAIEPNKIRAYSNPAYTLLGHMIYKQTQTEYDQYIRKEILEPLNMNNTEFNAVEKSSKTYDKDGKLKKDVSLRDLPAGGLYSNTADMVKFAQAFLKKSPILLNEESYNEIFESQHPNSLLDLDERYGLGWGITTRPHTGDIFYHTGTTLYFNSAIAIAPEVGLAVIFLTNSENGNRVFRKIHDVIESTAKAKGMPVKPSKSTTDLGNAHRIKDVSALDLEKHEGLYVTPGATINVHLKKDKLFMKLQGIKAELIPVSKNAFLPKPLLFGFIPIKLKKNRMYFEEIDGHSVFTQMELGGRKELLAEKIESKELVPQWQKRLGEYEITNQKEGEIDFFKNFSLIEKDGMLTLHFSQASNGREMDMALEITGENEAKIAGLGRYAGQCLVAEGDIIQIFGLNLKKKKL